MPETPKIVAFLQNAWFKNPERMKAIYARHGVTPEDRAHLNAIYLFFGCLTGRRLRAAFGEQACDRIVWENASAEMAGRSSDAFKADPAHMARVLEHFKPRAVLVFGTIARKGLMQTTCWKGELIVGPHPAARHPTVVGELCEMAANLRELQDRWAGNPYTEVTCLKPIAAT